MFCIFAESIGIDLEYLKSISVDLFGSILEDSLGDK